MIVMVIGTPDSGKSERAEQIALELSGGGKKYYIATMIPFGEEGHARVEKHRRLRDGKGFITVERPTDVHKLPEEMPDIKGSTCLLECMSNLIGNEMHRDNGIGINCHDEETDKVELDDKITESVLELAKETSNMVIVTNTFPTEDEAYDDDTRAYVKLVDRVNDKLRKKADRILEISKGEWKLSENT